MSVTGINLAKGATATIQLTVQLNSPLAGVTQISNQGVVNYDSNQGGVNNTTLQTDGDPAVAGQQPTNTAIPNTDLAVTKTVDNSNSGRSRYGGLHGARRQPRADARRERDRGRSRCRPG